MSRKILCEQCGKFTPMHPEDVAMGLHRRRVVLTAKKPSVHEVKTYSDGVLEEHIILPSLLCDICGTPIADGQQAIAVTMWRGDNEPENWEKEYQQ